MENILTKTVSLRKRDWAKRLDEAVWAYNTAWKTTGFSPYKLVYGKKPIMPIEFELKTLKTVVEVGIDLPESEKSRIL